MKGPVMRKHIKLATFTLIFAILPMIGFIGVATAPYAGASSAKENICTGSGGTWGADPDDKSTSPKNICTNASSSGSVDSLFKNIVNILLFVIGGVSVIMIVVGGLRYVLSNGDSSAVTSAKNTILYAVVGLVIAMFAYAIVNFVIKNF